MGNKDVYSGNMCISSDPSFEFRDIGINPGTFW